MFYLCKMDRWSKGCDSPVKTKTNTHMLIKTSQKRPSKKSLCHHPQGSQQTLGSPLSFHLSLSNTNRGTLLWFLTWYLGDWPNQPPSENNHPASSFLFFYPLKLWWFKRVCLSLSSLSSPICPNECEGVNLETEPSPGSLKHRIRLLCLPTKSLDSALEFLWSFHLVWQFVDLQSWAKVNLDLWQENIREYCLPIHAPTSEFHTGTSKALGNW